MDAAPGAVVGRSDPRALLLRSTGRGTRRWSPFDIYQLVAVVGQRLGGTPGWAGGGFGPRLCGLLGEDPELARKTLPAIGCALDRHDLESAVRLLVIHQHAAAEPWNAAEEAVIEYPALFRHPYTTELRDRIAEDGFVPVC
jgi:hypothetical protein